MTFSKNDTARVKGIAILMLLFHHLFYNPKLIEQREIVFRFIPQEKITAVAIGARICVWIFVFLSAYGLASQYRNCIQNTVQGGQTTLSFYVKRWLSLIKSFLPAYIFVFIGYWIIRGNPFAKVYSSNPLRMLLDVVGIADLFQSPMIIAVWWYMSLAQMIILVIPLLYKLVQNFGFGSYILVYMLLQFLPDGVKSNYGGKYLNYLLVAVLAVCMENASIWESLLKKRGRLYKSILEFVLLFALIVGLIFVKVKIQSVDSWQIGGFVSGVATLLIVILVTKYLSPKPIDLVLRFLGGHSGNIFMIHAFLYGPCKFIVFWSHNAIISYFTLLILSVCVSVILEFIKKVTRYNALFNTVSKKITNKINI